MRKDVAVADAACKLAGHGARPAADLEDAHARAKRQRVHDRREAGRQAFRHYQALCGALAQGVNGAECG